MPDLTALIRAEYPRSSTYDPQWQVDNCMGPNPLWLVEDLLRDVELRPGMRVLDLGCGSGMTSTFLAREYGVDVVAADHWVAAAANRARFHAAGVSDLVTAVDAEAHRLPFDEGEFDAIISVGSYHYFGTDDLYIGYVSRFLKPGGTLAIASPGSVVEARDVGACRSTYGNSSARMHCRSTLTSGGASSGTSRGTSRSRRPDHSGTAGRIGCSGAESAPNTAPRPMSGRVHKRAFLVWRRIAAAI